MSEVSYYYVRYDTSTWLDPENVVDGDTGTYGYTSTAGARISFTSSDCSGADLGTITKVEARIYGYGDGDDEIALGFDEGINPGTQYGFVPASSPGWTGYIDVTNSEKVDGWTWGKVKNLNSVMGGTIRPRLQFNKIAKGNTIYCAKVEIRVTYTPSSSYYHGLKYSGGELALCDVGTNPLRIRKGDTTYGIELVETDDPNASPLRIYHSGIKSIRKYT
jgi:hypothetical protein